jgi:tyrosinase
MAATKVVSRESIESWSPDSPKLLLFRKAVEGMQAISDTALMDERGYQWVAGVHGGFGGQPFCHHGDDHFLTWHRPYLVDMELKLRAQVAEFADEATADEWRLPYWDWANPDTAGIPQAFTDETYEDGGETKPNPLLSAPYQLPFDPNVEPPDAPSDATWRDPKPLADLQALRPLVDAALDERAFHDFSTAIEEPHNKIHTWVRGFMATYRSAFDPIFWAHHANIDRFFWQWQQGEGHMSTVPQSVRDLPCQPFNFKDIRAEAFFDTRDLGYAYSIERQLVVAEDAVELREAEPLAPLPFDFGTPPARFTRARINVHGVRHPERNLELRFFADDDQAIDAATPRDDVHRFMGSYLLLGHGACPGAPGHCDPDLQTGVGLRPPHHLAPFDIFIDVTRGVGELAGAGADHIRARMIVVDDVSDQQVPTLTVRFDNASLTFR